MKVQLISKSSKAIFIMLLAGFLFSSCKTPELVTGTPLIDSSIVFEPVSGYASMRIPALIMTKKGTLLAFCEGRIGTASDWADMDLLMKRSTDGGKTWEAPVIIAPHEKGQPTSNATPILSSDGTVHLLYQRDYARAYYTTSKDDGKTWSKATDITYAFDAFKPEYDWKVLAPGPGHAIQLKSGRLLVPVWLSDPNRLVPHRSHGPSCVATIYSDDLGKTWKRGAIAAHNAPDVKSPNETMAVQLEDGRVMLNIRNASTDVHRRAVSYSRDGISNWSTPAFDKALFDPICMASILKVPTQNKSGKTTLIFVNPDSRNIEKYPRKNLTAKLSFDDGENWTVQKVICPGPSGYSDLAIGADGTLYCLYETNTIGKGWNYSLVLKRFNFSWLRKDKQN